MAAIFYTKELLFPQQESSTIMYYCNIKNVFQYVNCNSCTLPCPHPISINQCSIPTYLRFVSYIRTHHHPCFVCVFLPLLLFAFVQSSIGCQMTLKDDQMVSPLPIGRVSNFLAPQVGPFTLEFLFSLQIIFYNFLNNLCCFLKLLKC